jgi:hypothetical protein
VRQAGPPELLAHRLAQLRIVAVHQRRDQCLRIRRCPADCMPHPGTDAIGGGPPPGSGLCAGPPLDVQHGDDIGFRRSEQSSVHLHATTDRQVVSAVPHHRDDWEPPAEGLTCVFGHGQPTYFQSDHR